MPQTVCYRCMAACLQAAECDREVLECSILLLRSWTDAASLGRGIRRALTARPTANAILLQGLGALVLAPGLQSLYRRMAALERLILLASGALQPSPPPSRTASEALGAYTISDCYMRAEGSCLGICNLARSCTKRQDTY